MTRTSHPYSYQSAVGSRVVSRDAYTYFDRVNNVMSGDIEDILVNHPALLEKYNKDKASVSKRVWNEIAIDKGFKYFTELIKTGEEQKKLNK